MQRKEAKRIACLQFAGAKRGCSLVKKHASKLLNRTITDEEFDKMHKPFTGRFEPTSFLVNVFSGNNRAQAMIDTAADVCLVSRDVVEDLYPKWIFLPNAGEIKIKSYSEHRIPVIASKYIPISFESVDKKRSQTARTPTVLMRVVITGDSGSFLIGSDFLQDQGMGLRNHVLEGWNNYYLTLPSEVTGHEYHIPVETPMQEQRAANVNKVSLAAKESVFAEFVVESRSRASHAIVSNITCHSENVGDAQKCLIYPSLSPTKQDGKATYVRALLVNTSKGTVVIDKGQMQLIVEYVSDDDLAVIPVDELNDKEEREKFLKGVSQAGTGWSRQIVADAPLDNLKDMPDGLYDEEDVADFSELDEVPDEATFGEETESLEPIDLLPWKDINPRYHTAVRYLFEKKYPNVLSRSQYDCGNISKTLGCMYIPLIDKTPKSRKVYFSNDRDLRQLNDILVSMLKHGIIKRSQSAYGAPVFLIRRKSGQQPLRLLCAICDLNEVLAKPVPILPNIEKLLHNLTSTGVGLMSSLDLTNGFHSVEIYKPHQSRLSFLTPFGSFKFARGVMGLSTLPAFYAAKIFELIHTDPLSKAYDPISGVWPFMDDIPIVSPADQDEDKMFSMHFKLLDKVLHRISYHNAKISPTKLELFKKEAIILGHLLKNNRIYVDPKRLDKIKNAPMITNLKSAQKWSGFLASLKPFAPLELGKCHAVISELTSSKKEFKIEDRHVEAFNKMKDVLTSHEFVLDIPNPNNVKVLYTDASQLSLGAMLLEIDFEIEIEKTDQKYLQRVFLEGDPLKETIDELGLDIWPSAPIPGDGNCFYHALIDQFTLMGLDNFPHDVIELRLALVNFLTNHIKKHEWNKLITVDYQDWDAFVQEMATNRAYTDNLGIMNQIAAEYIRRDIMIVTPGGCVHRMEGGSATASKPPLWLGFYPPQAGADAGHFISLINGSPNAFTPFITSDVVKYDVQSMTQDNIFEAVKEMLDKKRPTKHKLKVLAYHSKVVAETDRHKAIYEKELMALISALNAFEDYISHCPCVVTFIDSRTAYFLMSSGIHKSSVKCRRWNVLFQTRFPNLLLKLVGTNDNWSDVMSRLFEVPETVERQLQLRNLDIMDLPEMDGKLVTYGEMTKFCEDNPHLLEEKDTLTASDIAKIQQVEVSYPSLKVLNLFQGAINVLRDRLSVENLICAQKEECECYSAVRHGDLCDQGYEMRRELIHKDGKIVVPPSLVWVLLSYMHLVCGHGGRDKLLKAVRANYYMPHDKEKITHMVQACQSCFVTNKQTGPKLKLGGTPLPEFAFHTVFMDLLEGMPKNQRNINYLLVMTCYLTKFVIVFPMRQKTAAEFLDHMKTFLQMTGAVTHYCYTDNASVFREKKVLQFMAVQGIELPRTSAYHSRARGAVEIQNKLIVSLLTKILVIAPSYDFTDLIHLPAILLNNTVNSSTQIAPNECIFGFNTFDRGPLGLNNSQAHLRAKMLNVDMRVEAARLRESLKRNLDKARQEVSKKRARYLEQRNQHKKDKHDFEEGDIVFIKNYSQPQLGGNKRFRPVMSKSPYIVCEVTPTTVFVMRLVDKFPTTVHVDFVKKFSAKDPDFADLPHEVLAILGKPITERKLCELAKVDKLEMVYSETLPTKPGTRSMTRGELARRRAKLERLNNRVEDLTLEEAQEMEDDDDSGDPTQAASAPKGVRFTLPE